MKAVDISFLREKNKPKLRAIDSHASLGRKTESEESSPLELQNGHLATSNAKLYQNCEVVIKFNGYPFVFSYFYRI